MPAIHYKRKRMGADMAVYTRLMAQDNGEELQKLCHQLSRALREEVTQRQRQMLFLYYDQGMTMDQIGEALGVDRTTVSRTIKRGEARLRRCLRYGGASFLRETLRQEEQEENFCGTIDKRHLWGR